MSKNQHQENNINQKLKVSRRRNRRWVIRGYLLLFLLGVITTAATLIFTPLLSRLSLSQFGGYISEDLIIEDLHRIDSMRYQIEVWHSYNQNIFDIIQGKKPSLEIDSINSTESQIAPTEEFFASSYEQVLREKSSSSLGFDQRQELITYNFYPPLIGDITKSFDNELPYIEINTSSHQNVLSISDGSVIAVYWSEQSGNTIQIQHADNIISSYSLLSMVSKKVGDKVLGGESLGYIGSENSSTENQTLNPNSLVFELWHNGNRVNPENYIVF